MKIFITGASGYIGFAVAAAFRRAGHNVHGLVRSEEKAGILARHEIHPLIGDMNKPETYQKIAEQCSVLIHAAADYQADTFALDKKTVETLIACGKLGARPKTLIYSSGVWVYGNTGDTLADETTPLNPAKAVARRPAIEQMVLTASRIKGIVIRPGCVYGRRGGLTGTWFNGAHKEHKLGIIGDGNNRWAMVHVDDTADAYLRAAESGLGGEAFNITDRSRNSVREMAMAAARASGFTGKIELIPIADASKTMGDFAECLALDQHVDARKAVRLLGWQPKHGGFTDEATTYFESWKASQIS